MFSRRMCLVGVLALILAGSVSADLVLHWKLDDGAGSVATDSSGHGRDGTIGGTPQWVAGMVGGALDFDGATNYIDVRSETVRGTCSISLWIMPRNLPYTDGFRSIMHTDAWTAGAIHGHLRNTTSLFNFDVNGGGAVTSTTVAQSDTWYHVAATFDVQAGESRLYINGIEEAAATGLSSALFLGPLNFGAWTSDSRFFHGIMDDIRIYDHVLQPDEVQAIMRADPEMASEPVPEDGATDVPREVVLGWTAGEFAATRDVYFGRSFTDVNDAGRTDPREVLASQGQTATTFDLGLLEYGTTYYWRIDEVNAPPDSTIFKGEVWSFETEPYAYLLEGVTATASSFDIASPPERTVDGSGLDPLLGEHSNDGRDMWLSSPHEQLPAWIQFELPGVRRLHQMKVWNFNASYEPIVGYGAKDVVIEYSLDGEQWLTLKEVEIPRGPATGTYAGEERIGLDDIEARFVRLMIESNWSPMGLQSTGLSEVQFWYAPMQAREPRPADGATGVALDTNLTWRPGREAELQEVYLGTDADAVAVDTVPAGSQIERTYTPPALNLGTTYFWRVDQVGDLGVYAGELWSFTTQEYLVIDDFESYDDTDNPIWDAWHDGYDDDNNGSQVGHDWPGPYAERSIVHSGRQSMPLYYDNSGAATYSEATHIFDPPQDWTKHGLVTLSLSFHGDRDNTGQMYLKINDTKVPYDGKAEDIKRTQWQPWHIDLASTGATLRSVTKIGIGIEGAGTAGVLYFDDIRLYGRAPEFATPTDPGTPGLVAWYKFDGNLNDSHGTHHGAAVGDATTVNDPIRGQVLTLDGIGDGVKVPLLAASTNTLTIAMWAKTTADPLPIEFAGLFHGDGWAPGDLHWRYNYGRIDAGINGVAGGDLTGISVVQADQWNHVAVTVSPTEWTLWLNGLKEASRILPAPATVILGDGLIGAWIGTDGVTISRSFTGQIDDARFYDRALSQEELAFLAGRTEPFYKPFP